EIGRKCIIIKADIGKINEITEMFLEIREFGRLDILVNNAAVAGWTNLFEMTEDKWDSVIDTNLKGTFFCSLEAARIMKENNGGCIVNISSSCAQLGVRYLDAYTASKGGIHALTKQLAVELAKYNIRVNTFAPGLTNVDRNLKDDPGYRTSWGSVIPLGRTAEPEEMVGPAVFLASEDSSFMTGQLFYVDGGWSIKGTLPEDNFEKAVGSIPW
ncbi:MAG: SDR family oxidoreductase, partial [Clostridiales bacterium]|nr:SDR family oxidoreductase [Clostridiales bacterium]